MAWIDLKRAYDSVDHGWLNGVMLHRFPTQMYRVIAKLWRSWNTSSWLSQGNVGKNPYR